MSQTYALLDVSIETAAGTIKLKRLKVLVSMQRWLMFSLQMNFLLHLGGLETVTFDDLCWC